MGNATPEGAGEPAFDLFDRWLAHREQESSDTLGDRAAPDPQPEHESPLFHETLVELDLPADDPLLEEGPLAPGVAEAPISGVRAPVADEAPTSPAADPPVEALPGNDAARAVLAAFAASRPIPVTEAPANELPGPVAVEAPTSPVTDPPVGRRPENEAARAVFAAFTASRPSPVTPPIPGPEVALAERGAAAVARTRDRGPVIADPLPATVAPRSARPVTTAAPVQPPAEPASTPAARAVRAVRAVVPVAEPSAKAPEAGVPMVVEFKPRTGVRRLVGLLLLAALAATALATYDAYQDRTSTSIGVAATLGVLTAIIWATRAGSAVAELTVRGGQLEIMRGGSRHQFDLASGYAPLQVVGEPGSRGWKVLIERRGMAPYVIDASMVDPAEFMRVLRHYRPA